MPTSSPSRFDVSADLQRIKVFEGDFRQCIAYCRAFDDAYASAPMAWSTLSHRQDHPRNQLITGIVMTYVRPFQPVSMGNIEHLDAVRDLGANCPRIKDPCATACRAKHRSSWGITVCPRAIYPDAWHNDLHYCLLELRNKVMAHTDATVHAAGHGAMAEINVTDGTRSDTKALLWDERITIPDGWVADIRTMATEMKNRMVNKMIPLLQDHYRNDPRFSSMTAADLVDDGSYDTIRTLDRTQAASWAAHYLSY